MARTDVPEVPVDAARIVEIKGTGCFLVGSAPVVAPMPGRLILEQRKGPCSTIVEARIERP
jgi:hypothetical protein